MTEIKNFLKKIPFIDNINYYIVKICKMRYRLMNNKKFAEKTYKKITGKKLDINNPKTYDEKLWWLKYNVR